MMTPCLSPCTNDEELISYYPEPDYWQLVHEQQSVYDSAANNTKKEQYIKSPLIIYNHCYAKGAIEAAYLLRQQLEKESKNSMVYTRPIVLFLVPHQWKENIYSIQELKRQFILSGIPPEEIRIKINQLDELETEDLLSTSSKVRYIITTTHLEDRWRCPFAYILVSLDERNVIHDLTTALNYLLPLPSSAHLHTALLRSGYILTASTRFEGIKNSIQTYLHHLGQDTRQIIVKDNLIGLLKQLSVLEILHGEIKYNGEGIPLRADPLTHAVVKDLKKLVYDHQDLP
jgi:hypothetical protein